MEAIQPASLRKSLSQTSESRWLFPRLPELTPGAQYCVLDAYHRFELSRELLRRTEWVYRLSFDAWVLSVQSKQQWRFWVIE